MHFSNLVIACIALFPAVTTGIEYDTSDGPGFPACHNVSAIYQPTTVDEMVSLVKMASASNIPVRASGKGHMWYDTMCSDDNQTIIIQTKGVHSISDFNLDGDTGSVVIEARVTFFERTC